MTSKKFWDAYEALCTVDSLYDQRRPIYQLFWCLEYAQPTAEHPADTQRVYAELGIPTMEQFD